jgi:hypothetical protein
VVIERRGLVLLLGEQLFEGGLSDRVTLKNQVQMHRAEQVYTQG